MGQDGKFLRNITVDVVYAEFIFRFLVSSKNGL